MRRGIVLVVLLALALGWATAPVVADDPREELERVQSEIEELTSRINRAEAESRRVAEGLEAAQQSLAEAQAEVDEAQAEVDAVQAEIDEKEARRAELIAEIEETEADLVATQVELRATKDQLQRQAVALYMDASASMMPMMLEFEDASQVAVGIVYAGGLAAESEDLVSSYEFLAAEVDRQRQSLEADRAEVEEIIAGLDEQRQELEAKVAELEQLRAEAADDLAEVQSLLADLQARIAAAEQHKEGLEADARRLEAEIAAQQQRGGQAPGVLAWPVNGPVTSPYGYRVHPIFGTRKLHTGVDISVPYGATIRASGSGTVILASPYGGYGNAVVIDHGGGLATLYAHQSSIAVSYGQTVSTGDVVGYIGCTGYCTGPHLHFETRENGVPVDPMKYLGG